MGCPPLSLAVPALRRRLPSQLHDLLLDDPPDAEQLCERLLAWHNHRASSREMTLPFAEQLRRRTWTDMAADFVRAMTDADAEAAASRQGIGRQNGGPLRLKCRRTPIVSVCRNGSNAR